MKKVSITACLALLFVILTSPESSAVPDYAKWGIIAVKAAQQKYNAEIIDYKHVGRAQIQPELAEENFKLWIRSKAGQEFGVLVRVRFNPSNDQLRTILFTETSH